MSNLTLSAGYDDVSLHPTTGATGRSNDVCLITERRLKMYYPTTHSMMTMHNVPKLDRKLVRYGASWIVAIATSVVGVAAFA
jgi:hypothetical protein